MRTLRAALSLFIISLVTVPTFAILATWARGMPFGGAPDMQGALVRSVLLGLLVAAFSAIGGWVIASVAVTNGLGRLGSGLIVLALLIPDVPLAFALRTNLDRVLPEGNIELLRIAMGQTWFPTALASLLIIVRLKALGSGRMIELSRVLGAKRYQRVLLLLKLAGPAMQSSFLIAFAYSLQDPVFPLFLGGSSFTVLPELVYAGARFGLQGWMVAYTAGVITFGVVIVCVTQLSENRREIDYV